MNKPLSGCKTLTGFQVSHVHTFNEYFFNVLSPFTKKAVNLLRKVQKDQTEACVWVL